MSKIGVMSTGIKLPIIKNGDDLRKIMLDTFKDINGDEVSLKDGDIIGITESIVAKSQKNYVTQKNISQDIINIFGEEATVGVVFPIFSRNRFSSILKGISMGAKKVYVQLNLIQDEVGNKMLDNDSILLAEKDKVYTEESYRNVFGNNTKHMFTGVDYIELYKSLGDNIEIIISDRPNAILQYTKNIIVSTIHNRKELKDYYIGMNVNKVIGIDNILNVSIEGSGYNSIYGLLGSNIVKDGVLKLFPRDCTEFVNILKSDFKGEFGVDVEFLVYGDGAFKDPIGGIWELADPVTSPGFTDGLKGYPNEIKLKYIVDNEFDNLSREKQKDALNDAIKKNKKEHNDLKNSDKSLGTTPRRIIDLVASLCDLTSGSGDKGTPVILIQNYFSDYTT